MTEPIPTEPTAGPGAASPAGARPRGTRGPGGPNHVSHGMYASGLPKGAQRVGRRRDKFRRTLENAVLAREGEISLTAGATINTAVRWETVAQLAARWLRLNHDSMSHDQRLVYARQVAVASEKRDGCLRQLDLDSDVQTSVWDRLDRRRLNAIQNAAASDTRDVEAASVPSSEPSDTEASTSAVGVGRNGNLPDTKN